MTPRTHWAAGPETSKGSQEIKSYMRQQDQGSYVEIKQKKIPEMKVVRSYY